MKLTKEGFITENSALATILVLVSLLDKIFRELGEKILCYVISDFEAVE